MNCSSFSAAALSAICALIFSHTARADDLKAMAGKWKIEKAEAGGKEVESDDLKGVLLTIFGERYEVLMKDKQDAGTLKVDEKQMPKTIDSTDTEGDDVGKIVKAIYEISGDTMRVCYALDGGERPTEFATKPDTALLLITYKREK